MNKNEQLECRSPPQMQSRYQPAIYPARHRLSSGTAPEAIAILAAAHRCRSCRNWIAHAAGGVDAHSGDAISRGTRENRVASGSGRNPRLKPPKDTSVRANAHVSASMGRERPVASRGHWCDVRAGCRRGCRRLAQTCAPRLDRALLYEGTEVFVLTQSAASIEPTGQHTVQVSFDTGRGRRDVGTLGRSRRAVRSECQRPSASNRRRAHGCRSRSRPSMLRLRSSISVWPGSRSS